VSPWTGGGSDTELVPRICRLNVSGSGIPGVGVAPGLNGLRKFAASGIPGVGVAPFGTTLAFAGSGIPGVVFADGGIGLVDKPGGKLFASTLTAPVPTPFTFVFATVFDSVVEPHANISTEKLKAKRQIKTLDIN
jgi:hypothetical protein